MNFDNFFVMLMMIVSVYNAVTTQTTPTNTIKCIDIPLQCIDYTMLILMSPFSVYRTTLRQFNCGHAAFINYAGDQSNYTGSIIVVNKQSTYTFDCIEIDSRAGTIFQCKECSTGYLLPESRVIYSNLQSKSRASFCVALCLPNKPEIQTVECYGRTAQDEIDINNFLSTLTTPIVTTLYNSQQNCTKSQYCALFP